MTPTSAPTTLQNTASGGSHTLNHGMVKEFRTWVSKVENLVIFIFLLLLSSLAMMGCLSLLLSMSYHPTYPMRLSLHNWRCGAKPCGFRIMLWIKTDSLYTLYRHIYIFSTYASCSKIFAKLAFCMLQVDDDIEVHLISWCKAPVFRCWTTKLVEMQNISRHML